MLKYNDKNIANVFYSDRSISQIYYNDKKIWQKYTIFLTKLNGSVDKFYKESVESQEFRETKYKKVVITGAVKTIRDYSFYLWRRNIL